MSDRVGVRQRSISLMERILARDERALRELYDLHAGLLFAIGFRLLHDRGDAEQLLIDVFAEIWERADRYDPQRGDPVTYLVTLTRSRALDRLRANRHLARTTALEEMRGDNSTRSPLEQALAHEQQVLVLQALQTIAPEQRRAVELAFLDGMTHAQVAEQLNKPLGTVKTHVRQGLIQLRSVLRTLWQGDRGDS